MKQYFPNEKKIKKLFFSEVLRCIRILKGAKHSIVCEQPYSTVLYKPEMRLSTQSTPVTAFSLAVFWNQIMKILVNLYQSNTKLAIDFQLYSIFHVLIFSPPYHRNKTSKFTSIFIPALSFSASGWYHFATDTHFSKISYSSTWSI